LPWPPVWATNLGCRQRDGVERDVPRKRPGVGELERIDRVPVDRVGEAERRIAVEELALDRQGRKVGFVIAFATDAPAQPELVHPQGVQDAEAAFLPIFLADTRRGAGDAIHAPCGGTDRVHAVMGVDLHALGDAVRDRDEGLGVVLPDDCE
jgi:hypothetical protein